MPQLALEFEVDAAQAEAMADALLELGVGSVSMEDAEAGSDSESPLYAEPSTAGATTWRRNRLTALLAHGTDEVALIRAATAAAGISPPPRARSFVIDDEDWVWRTRQQFGRIRAGQHLWIVPQWCDPPQDPRAIVVRLDPGLAFGTGRHPTTRLVLAWLEGALGGGERVLDYGCGSGILAIVAAKLGAAQVAAVDLDRQAIEAATANAKANGVTLQIATPEALMPGPFDVIVSNILARPLIALAAEFAARTRRGARVALSGILRSQAGGVIAAHAAAFDWAVAAQEDDWVLLDGVRR